MEHTSERAFVRMTGVGHRYDPTPGSPMAVQGIDLDIHRHEFVAVSAPRLRQVHLAADGLGPADSKRRRGQRIR